MVKWLQMVVIVHLAPRLVSVSDMLLLHVFFAVFVGSIAGFRILSVANPGWRLFLSISTGQALCAPYRARVL